MDFMNYSYMFNRHRKKIIYSFLLIKTCVLIVLLTVCSQNVVSAQSVSHIHPVWQWRCDTGDALLNFNPAVIVDSTRTLIFDSIPYSKNYTIVVVYKPVVEAETMVWRLDYGTGFVRGLTTEQILSGNTAIRYTDTTIGIPVINTLRQTAPDSTAPFVRLTLGGDTLAGSVNIAEVLYFSQRLDNSMLRRVQSALAIRYGITLGPVDYVDGEGGRIWRYADSGMYHHRVTGVGNDSTYRVCQLQSRSEMPDPILTIRADSLSEGHFFVCGDNDAPLSFESDGEIEILNRKWRVNCTNCGDDYLHLTFDTRGFASMGDSLVLIADGYVFLPSAVSHENVSFNYISFMSDTSIFTLAKGSVFWQTAKSNGNSGYCGRNGESEVKTYLYPNPSTGSYTIEVTGAEWVKINIYNAQGVLMSSFGDSDQWQYFFNGSLPSGNSYYATVTTESGTQTMKLIVK